MLSASTTSATPFTWISSVKVLLLFCLLMPSLLGCVGGREHKLALSTRNPVVASPIDLTRFQVKSTPTAIRVGWETATELGSAYFEIERSADDAHYEVVGRVPGNAMAVTTQQHTFVDDKPLPTSAYYRLRQVDLDGVVHLSLKQLVRNEPTQQLMASR